MTEAKRVAVIGAGAVGVCCALFLRRDGHDVTLIDRLQPGEGCSFGNAGLLARSSFMPLAGPSAFLKVPGWLMDPEGPLSIRWSYLPRLVPWLARYVHAGYFQDVDHTARALQVLCDPTVELFKKLVEEAGRPDLVRDSDYIWAYRTEKGFRDARPDVEARRRHGVHIAELDAVELHEREPALAADFRWGYIYRDHGFTVDPENLVKALADLFRREGGRFKVADVRDVDIAADGMVTLICEGDRIVADAVVLAAGAHSRGLARKLGADVPLETERGYHIVCPHPGVGLSGPVMNGEGKFLATPMAMGLRFAGTVELGGLAAPPTPRRIEAITKKAKDMVPGLNTEGMTTWLGFRPSLPDSLPVIGPSPARAGVFFAFGHQHVGLTAGPRTGGLIADLVAGRAPNVDIAPYRADRF